MTQIATFYMVLAIHTQVGSPVAAATPTFRPSPVEKYYTVQVLATPVENRRALLTVYQSLWTGGHLVYYYPKRIDGRQYLRLRTGVFETRDQALAYEEELKQTEGLDGFVDVAEVGVARFQDQFRIVTTPSGIWRLAGTSPTELYTPARNWIDLRYTTPQISPAGDAIAFYDDYKIVRVTLDTGRMQSLRGATPEQELLHSVVRWSPDGRFLAYLDAVEWELPTRLWLVQTDGSDNRCLVADETQQTKVKSFQWDPRGSRIFYVNGPTHGTVTLGGSLCCVDLDGTRRTLVAAGQPVGTEVLPEFRIAGNLLEYRTVRRLPDGAEPQYSAHKLPIPDPNAP